MMLKAPFPNRLHGGTLLGFLLGLMAGLAVAVAIALYLNKGPIPFIGKGAEPVNAKAPASTANAGHLNSTLPDPNSALYPKNNKPPMSAEVTAANNAPVAGKDAAKENANSVEDKPAPKADAKVETFQVQAGAYQNPLDAENQRAKLAFAGLEAKISQAEVNGKTMHRVRLGPFAREEEANQMRLRLLELGINSTIIH